jgi:hypothetical protein
MVISLFGDFMAIDIGKEAINIYNRLEKKGYEDAQIIRIANILLGRAGSR